MSFKELEQKHNLVNRVIVACGRHPTNADISPLLEEILELFYEYAFVDGMAKQMHSSVDRAVNAMAKPEQKPEPIAWVTDDFAITYTAEVAQRWRDKGWKVVPFYAAPPRKPWVSLTDKDMQILVDQARKVPTEIPCQDYNERLLTLADAKLKELNT